MMKNNPNLTRGDIIPVSAGVIMTALIIFIDSNIAKAKLLEKLLEINLDLIIGGVIVLAVAFVSKKAFEIKNFFVNSLFVALSFYLPSIFALYSDSDLWNYAGIIFQSLTLIIIVVLLINAVNHIMKKDCHDKN